MRKFTDTELELAPKVAEVMGLGTDPIRTLLAINDKGEADHSWNGEVPLPLEHDCLEWLRGKVACACSTYTGKFHVHFMEIRKTKDPATENQVGRVVGKDGKTLLEALYRVILEIGGQDA